MLYLNCQMQLCKVAQCLHASALGSSKIRAGLKKIAKKNKITHFDCIREAEKEKLQRVVKSLNIRLNFKLY